MKDVVVKIKGLQVSAEAGEDEMEFVTEARLYKRNDAVYLMYEETELSGVPGCRTRLRFRDDEIQLKRFGEGTGIGNEIRFRKGERYAGLYDTPFGAVEMEVLTNDLKSTLSAEGDGQIDIDYDISLKGLLEGRNRLNITLVGGKS